MDSLHLAQAKIYAALFCAEHTFAKADVRVTYLELESRHTTEFTTDFTSVELTAFFDSVITEYLQWISKYQQWRNERDASIRCLTFPFTQYRAGQRQFAVAVYKTIKNRGKLFAEAPTGTGKTISVLFPALKAMGEARVEKIFYLTAKTIGRRVAEDTIELLRSSGLRFRAITITARDKICFNNGQPCDVKSCPFAIGYYDRIKDALLDALASERFTRGDIEAIAIKHRVCPFELSLDLSLWVDAIICDYNYVFDPSASLKRYFSADEQHDYAILLDEAHNLVDRAREMFSATLIRTDLMALQELLATKLPGCAEALRSMAARISRLPREEGFIDRAGTFVSNSAPAKLAKPLEQFMEEAEAWLIQEQPAEFKQALLDIYFQALSFERVLHSFDSRYATIYEKECDSVKLYCLDPSEMLSTALKRTGSSIFFSATLTPTDYFRQCLGGDVLDPTLRLDSPFNPEHLRVLVQDRIPTTFRTRAGSYDDVAATIASMISGKAGHYLVYFPSHLYLREVLPRYQLLQPESDLLVQESTMKESERDQFVSRFQTGKGGTLVGFAVMGGIFGEGLDLVGESLIGVAIVGVGLPQLCLERELIREDCQKRELAGFDFAYTYPGMNRVLQAAGRVIRTDTVHAGGPHSQFVRAPTSPRRSEHFGQVSFCATCRKISRSPL